MEMLPLTAAAPFLSLVVPVKDEEAAIPAFLARAVPVLDALRDPSGVPLPFEILFVDDGSTDATAMAIGAAHARDPRIGCVSLARNFGKEAALTAGLDHARGTVVVPIDVDLQDPPEVIADMVARWREGYEVVYGVRRDRRSDSWSKRVSAGMYYRAHNAMSDDKIPEHAGDFRLLDRRVVDAIGRMPERNRFMKGLFAWSGFRTAAVEYDRAPRTQGTTKFRGWRLWSLAVDGITSASTMPLRVWSYIGVVIALITFVYAVFVIVRTLLFGIDVPGYSSLMVAILFFGGLQLISLGVLGEYVGRILIETKQRPLYVVRERLGVNAPEVR